LLSNYHFVTFPTRFAKNRTFFAKIWLAIFSIILQINQCNEFIRED
jgi:hypothetical protein